MRYKFKIILHPFRCKSSKTLYSIWNESHIPAQLKANNIFANIIYSQNQLVTHKQSQFIQNLPEFYFYNFWPYSMNFETIKLWINYNHVIIGRNTFNTGKFKYVFDDRKIRVLIRVSKQLRVLIRVLIRVMKIIKKLRV